MAAQQIRNLDSKLGNQFKVLFVNEKGVPGPSSDKVDIQIMDLSTSASNAQSDSLDDVGTKHNDPDELDSFGLMPMELMFKNPQQSRS